MQRLKAEKRRWRERLSESEIGAGIANYERDPWKWVGGESGCTIMEMARLSNQVVGQVRIQGFRDREMLDN